MVDIALKKGTGYQVAKHKNSLSLHRPLCCLKVIKGFLHFHLQKTFFRIGYDTSPSLFFPCFFLYESNRFISHSPESLPGWSPPRLIRGAARSHRQKCRCSPRFFLGSRAFPELQRTGSFIFNANSAQSRLSLLFCCFCWESAWPAPLRLSSYRPSPVYRIALWSHSTLVLLRWCVLPRHFG